MILTPGKQSCLMGSDPEGVPAKEPNSTLTKQALIVDDFHDASSPFVRELDNNDEITKPMEGFDLSNLHENNHESKDGSQLSFVIRKHGGKKSLTFCENRSGRHDQHL